ncbi:MAG: hypothetical protein U9P90_00670 [Patescibacteria group bacterium]|nr:hypothetical protein [Patescibacteria group bacterium]
MKNKQQQLDKIMRDFYAELGKYEMEYEELTNELIKRLAERRLQELKKSF